MTVDAWAGALRDALLTVLRADDIDITPDAATGTIEISTDDWTLTIEHLTDDIAPCPSLPAPRSSAQRPTAWLAVDDEPDDPARYRAARRAVMTPAVDRALAQADDRLAGALRAALLAGADPFTRDLVAAWDPHSPVERASGGG